MIQAIIHILFWIGVLVVMGVFALTILSVELDMYQSFAADRREESKDDE
jgi:hypothetical protein